ncbi:MAG: hypothetical protein V7603_5551 [Micromonosporaceae bacterium]
MDRRRIRARSVGAIAVVLLAVSVGALVVATAVSPVRLRSASPANGTSLTTAPDQIALRFTARPDPAQVHIAVVDGARQWMTAGRPAVTGNDVVQRVAIHGSGGYLIGYHVVFGNGRQSSGFIRFTVLSGTPAARPAATGYPSPPPAGALGLPDGADPGAAHNHTGLDTVTLAVVCLDAAAVIVGFGLVRHRRRRPVAISNGAIPALDEEQENVESGLPD